MDPLSDRRKRLLATLAHVGYAIQVAKSQEEKGQVLLAIVTKYSDDTGSMTASFECEPFFLDLVNEMGFKTPEEMLEYMTSVRLAGGV